MTPSKEKEVVSRFRKHFRHAFIDGKAYESAEIFLLSELSRVEKETENRVWREASEMVLKIRPTVSIDTETHGQTLIMNARSLNGVVTAVVSDISSTLLSQVKQDE